MPIALMVSVSGCSASPEVKSAKHVAAGMKLMQKNELSRAILEFRNAVQITPKDPEAQYQLSLAYLAAGDLGRGVNNLRRTLELNPKHAGAELRLAQLMGGTDDPQTLKEAERRLQALLQDSPENPDALQSLAMTELKLGAAESAMQHLQQAVAAAPRQITLAVTLAEAKMRENDFQGAEEVLKKACENSPKSADAFAVLGRFYVLQKRYAEAEKSLQYALTLQANHEWSLMTLGVLYNATGRKQEAEQNFKKLADLPNSALKPLYGSFLFEQGRRDEALKEFERLAQKDPADRTARTRLVAAYRATNRVADAQKVLSNALKKNPKDLDALLQQGELYLGAGKYAEAEGDLNRVVHLKPDSPEVHYAAATLNRARGKSLIERQELSEALRLNPAFLPARLDLAKSMMGKDFKGALNLLDQAPGEQKNTVAVIEQRNWVLMGMHQWTEARTGVDRGLSSDRTPGLLVQDGALKSLEKRYDGARESFHEAMAKAPEDLLVLRFLVQSYADQKQMPAAVKEIQEHAAKHPKSAAVQYFLGTILMANGDFAKAREALVSAKAANPDFTPADLSLAQIDLKQSNWTVARQELTAILAKGENPMARLWLGMLEETVGNHVAAIEAFRKVVEDEPNNTTALNNLAAVLGENPGQVDEALKYAQKAKELNPGSAPIDHALGWILYQKGMYPMAIKYLETANTREPTARLKYHLAMAYLKAGQKERGRSVFEGAIRLDPTLPEGKTAAQLFR
jgi:tetratricopeptide (TPR) repeat protein